MASKQLLRNRRSTSLSKPDLAVLVFCVVIMNGCARQNAHRILAENFQAPEGSSKLLAIYEPWFGTSDHMNVGYSSHDPEVLRRQVEQARSMGISAFVVDWYGDSRPFLNTSFSLLLQVAYEHHFQVALMYNEAEDENGSATEDAIAALDQAYQKYVGPDVPQSKAYLTYKGRPVVFIFPKAGHTDWTKVREHVSSWAQPPLLIYKDQIPDNFKESFDGAYPWIHPGPKGWSADGSDWGEEYLESFYKKMMKQPDKITVGAAWPGFDDSKAPWGLNRRMDARCGKTFQDGLQLFHRYYSSADAPPFLLIETWNDYEEGSAVERLSFANCK